MRLAGAVITAALLAVLAAPARAVLLINPDGTPIGGALQRWADESRVATGAYDLTIVLSNECGPAQSPVGGNYAVSFACSTGPIPGYPAATPFRTYLAPTELYPGQQRENLYFELGHQFAWHFLTNRDRMYLARSWGLPHWHWWDTVAGIAAGTEDGLDGTFAAIYQDCAEGTNDQGGSIGLWSQGAPTAQPRINTCAMIDQVARRGRRHLSRSLPRRR